jgi:homoserine O-acetyltransferase/O-succinyltransferase
MSMRSWIRAMAFGAIATMTGLLPVAGRADPAYGQKDGDVVIHDVAFGDGGHLDALTLHYTTLGTPHRDQAGRIDNAVLLLHGTNQVGKSFLMPSLATYLFGPGQPLDAKTYYIVLPDGIGLGGSSKPSDGLKGHFPHYGYVDQVHAHMALLHALGVEHLRLVSGLSQGGMQTWLWGEIYPNAMDGLVPIATMPSEISGRNLLWRRMILTAIKNDPQWQGGQYGPDVHPTQWMEIAGPLGAMMVGNPDRMQEEAPDRAATLAYYDRLVAGIQKRDAADTYYDYDSSRDYNPAPAIDKIAAPLMVINFTDDQVNPAEFAVTRATVARLKKGQLVMIAPQPPGYGHLDIFQAHLWSRALGAFMETLPARP